jgi:hypothetical protein
VIKDWLLPPHLQSLLRSVQGKEPRAQYKRRLRDAVNWVAPPSLQSAVLGAYYRAAGVDISGNRELAGRYAGRRAFVIGNGPSLGALDLTRLAGEITIGANSFYKHPQAAAADLKFLCIGDASFMEDRPSCVAWHRTLARASPRAELMLHASARPLIEKHALYPHHVVRYFRRGVPTEYPELAHCDLTKPLNVGVNTGTVLSIPLALYLGCNPIVLIGFDCNWLESYTRSYHFYDTHELFPEFDSLAADQRWPRYEDQLVTALRDFEGHRLWASYCGARGIRIVNASGGGVLDTYERVGYDSLFGNRS